MKITRMLFDGRELHLSQSQSLPKLKAAAVHAIRSGGGMVEVSVVGDDEPVSVVVSAGVPLIFESRQIPDPPDDAVESEELFAGHDDWDLEI